VTWNTLAATCRTRFGGWNYTTLSNYRDCDGDITNRNGRLECERTQNDDDDHQNDDDNYGGWLPVGSYRSSCRNIRIDRSTLIAECRDTNGRWRYTELAGYRSCEGDIFNYNGILRCRRDDYDDDDQGDHDDYNLPGGTWRTTCRNGRVNGNVLYATCRDLYGNWRATSLDIRYCRDNVTNQNGVLTCGTGGGGYRRITLYRFTNYAGRSRTFSGDVPNLNLYGFGNLTSSVVIQGGVWQLCDKPNYRGYCVILDRSRPNLWPYSFNNRTESIRRIR
jgi:hypothetical protein